MPQLNPEFFVSQIFWLVIVFALIYVLVAKYFLPRVGNVVERRSSQIEEDIVLSEQIVEEYKAIDTKTAKLLEAARHEAYGIIDHATKKAETQISDKVAKIERDINKATAQKEEGLARMKIHMHGEIEKAALGIGGQITEQLIDKLELKGK